MTKQKSTGTPLLNWFDGVLREPKRTKKVGILAGLAIGVLALLYLLYSIFFLGRVYPNVFVGNSQYSGFKPAEITERLNQAVATTLSQPLTLTYEDKTYTVSAKDANWEADVAATAQAVMGVGRDREWYWDLYEQITAPVYDRRLTITATQDDNYLTTVVASVAEAVDTPAVDASATFDDGKLVVTHEKDGQVINQQALVAEILNRWSSGSTHPVELKRHLGRPSIVIDDEEALRLEAEKLASGKLTLSWPGGQKELTHADMRSLVDFIGTKKVGVLSSSQVLTASLTENKTKSFLQSLANESINQPAKEPKLGIKEGKVTILEQSAPGKVVDIDVSAAAVLAALQVGASAPVELTLKTAEPLITAENLDSLGIKEIIGRGETNFTGSPTNRRINIANGVRLLQSTLLKPGDEFSTVKTLGAVDGTTGFLPELVIKENRTTPEYGGGLCQVSTTLFRSVIAAGLKVTERQNHSYRVSYYEPPVGLDATIYLPKPDFKFLNDTGNHILVQGQVVGNRVIFELWGTKDGRTATVTEPVITNIIPAPPEVRVETDTLFRGEVKQIEKPHDGATAVAYYTVMKDGKVLHKQTFKSVYKPWAARFLVGTKEPPAPPPPTP